MSVRRALLFAYVEKYGSYVIALGSTVFISRLLSPEEVGAFAIGMALVGLVAVFREFGVSTYLVQEPELDARRLAAALTVTAAMGLGLALIVAMLAVPVAWFYGDQRLRDIILILAVSFALTPLGSVSQSLLVREMRFGVLAWVRLVHAVVTAVIGIVLAWLGHGAASLAWASLGATVVNSALSIAVRPHAMRLNTRGEDLRRVVAVGLPTTLVSLIDDLVNTIPDLMVGRWQGLAAAGLISRARGLSQTAHQVIVRAANPVFMSVFSKHRREGTGIEGPYLTAAACVCAVGWTLLASMAVLADPLIQVLFGPQWHQVPDLLRWLCLSAALLLLSSGAHSLLLAYQGAKDALRARLLALPFYVGTGAIGATVSVEAMAASTAVASAASTVLTMRAVRDRVGIAMHAQASPVLNSSLMPLVAAAGALPAALWYGLAECPSWVALLAGSMGAAVGAALGLFARKSPLQSEITRIWEERAASVKSAA